MGASLLVLKNKSDVAGSMSEDEIREVKSEASKARQATTDKALCRLFNWILSGPTGGTSWLAAQ